MEQGWDIRMKTITTSQALEVLKSFEKDWLSIKLSCGAGRETVSFYAKIIVESMSIEEQFIYFYGNGQDRLIINRNDLAAAEYSEDCGDLLLVLQTKEETKTLYLQKYLPDMAARLQNLSQTEKNLVITEGKTDWKHFKHALRRFQKNGEFTNLDIAFLEYGSEWNMGNKTLEAICNYMALFTNQMLRIFIFDADDASINQKYKNKPFIYHGNRVYSFVLPVPCHRRETPLVCVEHFYTDQEIKTTDRQGRRLFLAKEFDPETSRHLQKKNLYALDRNPSMAGNRILDGNVYLLETGKTMTKQEVYNEKNKKNIALSKNRFAENVYNEIPPFHAVCVDSFRAVFDTVCRIFQTEDFGEELRGGVFLKELENGFQVLSVFAEVENEQTLQSLAEKRLYQSLRLSDDRKNIWIELSTKLGGEVSAFPLPADDGILRFFKRKSKNTYHRIELHLCKRHIPQYCREIFSDAASSVLLNRILQEYDAHIKPSRL